MNIFLKKEAYCKQVVRLRCGWQPLKNSWQCRKEEDMADLKCAVENCCYNDQHLCSKGDILVGGKNACTCDETCCESFSQAKEGRTSFRNSVGQPGGTIRIDCKAQKCIHNVNCECVADRVDIKGCGACDCEGTACATFVEGAR